MRRIDVAGGCGGLVEMLHCHMLHALIVAVAFQGCSVIMAQRLDRLKVRHTNEMMDAGPNLRIIQVRKSNDFQYSLGKQFTDTLSVCR